MRTNEVTRVKVRIIGTKNRKTVSNHYLQTGMISDNKTLIFGQHAWRQNGIKYRITMVKANVTIGKNRKTVSAFVRNEILQRNLVCRYFTWRLVVGDGGGEGHILEIKKKDFRLIAGQKWHMTINLDEQVAGVEKLGILIRSVGK